MGPGRFDGRVGVLQDCWGLEGETESVLWETSHCAPEAQLMKGSTGNKRPVPNYLDNRDNPPPQPLTTASPDDVPEGIHDIQVEGTFPVSHGSFLAQGF